MAKNLIIVESPTKSKTLVKFLGRDFSVFATKGHVIDLPKSRLGVDLKRNFKPTYVVVPGRKEVLEALAEKAKGVKKIYLAPDPDREGEAIAWHVANRLAILKKPVLRATFNEITKSAVLRGIEKAGKIDLDLVNAQQARRILDRLVGYQVSPLLWKTVHRGLSAGRVQSVALRMICEREEAVKNFVPQEYWTIAATFATKKNEAFIARLVKIDGANPEIPSQAKADEITADIRKKSYAVSSVTVEEKSRNPFPPYITSTLQQDAARRLFFSAAKTMQIAQQLYEGVELGDEGSVGLITYMRTDSTRTAPEAVEMVRSYISHQFGDKYLPKEPRTFKARKGAQEAHEAIRPTLLDYSPLAIKRYLTKDQFKLYELIWSRFIASQMEAARFEVTTVEITGAPYLFRASAQAVKFDGFLAVYQDLKDENGDEEEAKALPPLKESDPLRLSDVTPSQHFTKPPPRFSEATLVKELEANGIGRPSTYAPTIDTLKKRGYVTTEKRVFTPTELGVTVNRILVEHFPDIFNVEFTAEMEAELDRIEEGEDNWVAVLKDFYGPFSEDVKKADANHRAIQKTTQEKTDEVCEKCGKPMVIRWGKRGRFLACSGYPGCKNTKPLNGEEAVPVEGEKCGTCGAPMLLKTGRFGKFLACSRYPECKTTRPVSTGVPCPEKDCGGTLVERQSKRRKVFYSCSNYPKCKFALWDKPVKQPCPACGAPFLVSKFTKAKGTHLKCVKCNHVVEQPQAETKVAQPV